MSQSAISQRIKQLEKHLAQPVLIRDLHKTFLTEHFNIHLDSVIHHNISSSEAFLKMALAGIAYCLIPRLQITDEIEIGALIDITPGFLMPYQICWHHWQLEAGVLQQMLQAIIHYAQQHLPQ